MTDTHLPDRHRNFAWKVPCRAATTANITIATALNNGDTLDGVTLATGDRVLVKNQSTGAQNGVYVVGTTPARAPDFDTQSDILGAVVVVLEGTAGADTIWLCTTNATITVDTTALVFVALNDHGTLTGLADDDHPQYATDADLTAHTGDTSDAHDASAVSVVPTGNITSTDVQAALAELDSDIAAGGIPATIFDAKGDLIVASAADTAARLAVGTNTHVLTADSAQALGVKWAAPAAGGTLAAAAYKRTSANYTTTSTTFVDVDGTNMALTITTGAHRVLIGVVATCENDTAGDNVYLDVTVDGTRQGGNAGLSGGRMDTASYRRNFSFVFMTDVLSAASHTFKLQWRVRSGGSLIMFAAGTAGADDMAAQFWVMEQAA